MDQIKVRVTRDDIRKGFEGSEVFCPIARAVRRMGKDRVRVDGYSIMTRSKFYDLPKRAERFVINFDEGKSVKPFTFVAKAPEDIF